jgi:hypothetical protein
MPEAEATDLDHRRPSADAVLRLLEEYEDTHEGIANRLLGRLIGAEPALVLGHLEAVRAILDERMVRSAGARFREGSTSDHPGASPNPT